MLFWRNYNNIIKYRYNYKQFYILLTRKSIRTYLITKQLELTLNLDKYK